MSVRFGMAGVLLVERGRFGYRAAAAAIAVALASAPGSATSLDLATIAHAGTPFQIQRSEVTIGAFRAFASATGQRTRAERDGGGFQYRGGWVRMPGWTWQQPYGTPGGDDEPAVHVTYDEAEAYCRWAGLRLPTDREWVLAAYTETRATPPAPFARGRTYPYPTGESPDGANHLQSGMSHARLGPAAVLGQGSGHTAVATTPAGVNGLFDMGANVWEWVDEGANEKRTRGGSWWYGPAQMQASAIYDKARDFPAVYIGFRCAK